MTRLSPALSTAVSTALSPPLLPTQPPAPAPPGTGGDPWEAAVGVLGSGAAEILKAGVVAVLEGVWQSGLTMLRGSFGLADSLTEFDIVAQFAARTGGGGLHEVTAGVVWLAILVAIGLFFTQLVLVAVRGGRGMWRAVTGPFQFGLAIALLWATIGTAVAAAAGLTDGLLTAGFGDGNFARIVDPPPADPAQRDPAGGVRAILVDQPDLGPGVDDLTRAVIMAVIGALGWVCAVGFAFEMIIRQAIILVVVAVSPIAAAGLLSEATSSWWWRTTRWLAAALLLEPALALVLVAGVGLLSSATEIAALLAAAAVLLSALFCPWAVYKLLAFVDPATGPGTQLRSLAATRAVAAGPGVGAGSRAAVEAAHVARFDRHARAATATGSSSGSGGSRAGRVAAVASAAGTVGSRAAAAGRAGYRGLARAGDTAGAAITTQGAQTGVGHGGGVPVRAPQPAAGPTVAPAPPATAAKKTTTTTTPTTPTTPTTTPPSPKTPTSPTRSDVSESERGTRPPPAPPVADRPPPKKPAPPPRPPRPPKQPPKTRSGDQ